MSDQARNIVWIASYPKSGNTWVRFLACNLLYGPQESASSLNHLVPDIHELGEQLPRLAIGGGLLKTHFVCSPRLPLLNRTAGAIYVVREPGDVLASNYHYSRRSSAESTDSKEEFERYFESFVLNRGDARWTGLGMGGWDENVLSWLGVLHPFPVVAVRYEDLARDPRSVCRTLAQLLKPETSAAEIDRVVESCSFQRMREVEEADIRARRVGIFYKPYLQSAIDSGARFMRRGAVGEAESRLLPEQRARLRDTFAPLLSQLGYLSDSTSVEQGLPAPASCQIPK